MSAHSVMVKLGEVPEATELALLVTWMCCRFCTDIVHCPVVGVAVPTRHSNGVPADADGLVLDIASVAVVDGGVVVVKATELNVAVELPEAMVNVGFTVVKFVPVMAIVPVAPPVKPVAQGTAESAQALIVKVGLAPPLLEAATTALVAVIS